MVLQRTDTYRYTAPASLVVRAGGAVGHTVSGTYVLEKETHQRHVWRSRDRQRRIEMVGGYWAIVRGRKAEALVRSGVKPCGVHPHKVKGWCTGLHRGGKDVVWVSDATIQVSLAAGVFPILRIFQPYLGADDRPGRRVYAEDFHSIGDASDVNDLSYSYTDSRLESSLSSLSMEADAEAETPRHAEPKAMPSPPSPPRPSPPPPPPHPSSCPSQRRRRRPATKLAFPLRSIEAFLKKREGGASAAATATTSVAAAKEEEETSGRSSARSRGVPPVPAARLATAATAASSGSGGSKALRHAGELHQHFDSNGDGRLSLRDFNALLRFCRQDAYVGDSDTFASVCRDAGGGSAWVGGAGGLTFEGLDALYASSVLCGTVHEHVAALRLHRLRGKQAGRGASAPAPRGAPPPRRLRARRVTRSDCELDARAARLWGESLRGRAGDAAGGGGGGGGGSPPPPAQLSGAETAALLARMAQPPRRGRDAALEAFLEREAAENPRRVLPATGVDGLVSRLAEPRRPPSPSPPRAAQRRRAAAEASCGAAAKGFMSSDSPQTVRRARLLKKYSVDSDPWLSLVL